MSRALSVNPLIGINYIPDNPRMATPPAYWLQRLYDFDGDLVVLPSRYRPFAYVLARRVRLARPMLADRALEQTVTQPDTRMCLHYGLVPVSLIFRTGSTWSIDNILRSLKARDIWAHGGAEKMADQVDAVDQAHAAGIRRQTRDDMYHRAGDAWRSYQARTGQRIKLDLSTPGTERRVQTAPSRSTAGLGLAALG